jgi:hypothetical protein
MKENESKGQGFRKRDLVGPLILVCLGVTLLLINVGVWEWTVLWTLFRIWPVLLIVSGIDLLVGRRSFVGSLIALALIVAVVGGAFWLAWTGVGAVPVDGGVEVVYPLDGATRAEIDVDRATGSLHVGALVDSANLVEGLIYLESGEELERSFEVEDGVADLSLQSAGAGYTGPRPIGGQGRGAWDLAFSSDVPLDLVVDLAVGDAHLDLTGLAVQGVDVDMAVGLIAVALPSAGEFRVGIDGAVGQIVVVVPRGLGVRAEVDAALVARQLPAGYERHGDVYYSPGYERAENHADLRLGLAVGSVVVRQATGE